MRHQAEVSAFHINMPKFNFIVEFLCVCIENNCIFAPINESEWPNYLYIVSYCGASVDVSI